MQRTITYRGFEIHVELTTAAEETFDVTFQIKGGTNLEVLGARGGRIRFATALLPNDGPTWWPKSRVKPQSTCYSGQSTDSSSVSRLLIGKKSCKVDVGQRYAYTRTRPGSVEVTQIIGKRLHPGMRPDNKTVCDDR